MLWIFLIIISCVIIRILYLLILIYGGKTKLSSFKRKSPAKTLICIGSGGHTTEMLNIVKMLDNSRYTPRIYVLADSDKTSEQKIRDQETKSDWELIRIPRSRSVHQSYLTSVFTTLKAFFYSLNFMFGVRPHLILSNGPGTCVPICLIGFIMKILFFDVKIVFVESICRAKSLSLSGKILLYFVDVFVVQSNYLKLKYPRTEYFGRLF